MSHDRVQVNRTRQLIDEAQFRHATTAHHHSRSVHMLAQHIELFIVDRHTVIREQCHQIFLGIIMLFQPGKKLPQNAIGIAD